MDISYKIRAFNKVTGSIVVEFENFAPFNIDLPLNDGKYPEGQELDQYIRGFLPIEFVKRIQTIAQGVENETSIESLVEPWPQPEVVPTQGEEQTPEQQGGI